MAGSRQGANETGHSALGPFRLLIEGERPIGNTAATREFRREWTALCDLIEAHEATPTSARMAAIWERCISARDAAICAIEELPLSDVERIARAVVKTKALIGTSKF